jgi:hypothetical protein
MVLGWLLVTGRIQEHSVARSYLAIDDSPHRSQTLLVHVRKNNIPLACPFQVLRAIGISVYGSHPALKHSTVGSCTVGFIGIEDPMTRPTVIRNAGIRS